MGADASGGRMYGEFTMECMIQLIRLLGQVIDLTGVRVCDLGSGLNKPLMLLAALFPQKLRSAIGVEAEPQRVALALHTMLEIRKTPTTALAPFNTVLLDITNMTTLNHFDLVICFDCVYERPLKQKIAFLWNKSESTKVIVLTCDPSEALKLGFKDILLSGHVTLSMMGSKEKWPAYIYCRLSASSKKRAHPMMTLNRTASTRRQSPANVALETAIALCEESPSGSEALTAYGEAGYESGLRTCTMVDLPSGERVKRSLRQSEHANDRKQRSRLQ